MLWLCCLVWACCASDPAGDGRAHGGGSAGNERLASVEARARGRGLFLEHCALCHGERADGRGARRAGFDRPPADFTRPLWRETATPERVYSAIRRGVVGTAMPGWPILEDGEIWDLVAYVLSVSEPPPSARGR
jgi:mono/diheme cytochrome c family protein